MSIIIIIGVHLFIFHSCELIVLGSNTINENLILPLHCRCATPSNKRVMIVASSLWLTFVDKRRGGYIQSPMLISSVAVCYQLPSSLETRTNWNSTSSSFRLCNRFLVLRNHFSNITQSFSADVSNFDLFSIN